jgi:hypothetical protein
MNIFFFYLNLFSMLIWLLPPLRQYGTRFFIFFLMFGFADITGALYSKYVDINSNLIVYIIITAIALLSLQEKAHLKKYLFYYSVMILAAVGLYIRFPDLSTGTFILLFINTFIILTLFKDLLNDFFNMRSFSIFLAILIFYQITNITKLATLLTGFQNNYFYFGFTTAIQILLGIFFSVFRYDYKRFILQLR